MSLIPYTTEYALSEFTLHGEYQILEKLQKIQLNTIFDVGCNIGEWTRMARSLHPRANIHMFEVNNLTFQKMIRNIPIDSGIFPNSFGLSNETKDLPLRIVPENDRVTTSVLNIHHENSIVKPGVVVKAEQYLQYYDINYIDYLKIDTEGHEYNVLNGFLSLLQEGKVACIQFEYGFINVLTKTLLIDFYQLLSPLGYELGMIDPNHIRFKPYNLTDENFIGPDCIAVHKSRPDIIDLLK